MSEWKRSFFSARYSNGTQSFKIEPHGRAGFFVYDDGANTYRIPYEYGTKPALFAIRPRELKTTDDSEAVTSREKQSEVCESIRAAIRAVHKKDVTFF